MGYLNVDWARDVEDYKNTSGGCFYIGNSFVSLHSRKQKSISLSTSKAKYIAASSGCTQLLWIKQMVRDYELEQGTMSLFVDNKSVIDISKNLVQHSMTKHIDNRHHFICQLVEEKVVSLDDRRSTCWHLNQTSWFQAVRVPSKSYRVVHLLGKPCRFSQVNEVQW